MPDDDFAGPGHARRTQESTSHSALASESPPAQIVVWGNMVPGRVSSLTGNHISPRKPHAKACVPNFVAQTKWRLQPNASYSPTLFRSRYYCDAENCGKQPFPVFPATILASAAPFPDLRLPQKFFNSLESSLSLTFDLSTSYLEYRQSCGCCHPNVPNHSTRLRVSMCHGLSRPGFGCQQLIRVFSLFSVQMPCRNGPTITVQKTHRMIRWGCRCSF